MTVLVGRKAIRGICAIVLAMGCGSRPQGATGAASFKTSVDQSSPLVGLSAGERAVLCADIQGYETTTLVPDGCRLYALDAVVQSNLDTSALSDSDLENACSAAYEACVSSAAKQNQPTTQDGGIAGLGTTGGPDGGTIAACEAALTDSSCQGTVSA